MGKFGDKTAPDFNDEGFIINPPADEDQLVDMENLSDLVGQKLTSDLFQLKEQMQQSNSPTKSKPGSF